MAKLFNVLLSEWQFFCVSDREIIFAKKHRFRKCKACFLSSAVIGVCLKHCENHAARDTLRQADYKREDLERIDGKQQATFVKRQFSERVANGLANKLWNWRLQKEIVELTSHVLFMGERWSRFEDTSVKIRCNFLGCQVAFDILDAIIH